MSKVIGIVAITMMPLTGCSSYGTSFDCEAGRGVGCKSISQVNEMINNKEIGENREVIEKLTEASTGIEYQPNSQAVNDKVMRLPERTLRIWVNSFSDEKGDHIGETYIHTVVAPGRWQEVVE